METRDFSHITQEQYERGTSICDGGCGNRTTKGTCRPCAIRDTHLIVPSAFQITDDWRFVQTKTFAEKESRVPVYLGEIHDAVGGPIASVAFWKDTLVTEAINERRGYARTYDPNQPLEDQIALITIIALKGKDIS